MLLSSRFLLSSSLVPSSLLSTSLASSSLLTVGHGLFAARLRRPLATRRGWLALGSGMVWSNQPSGESGWAGAGCSVDLFFSCFDFLSFSLLFRVLGFLLLLALYMGTSMKRERIFLPFTSLGDRITASNLARLSWWRYSSWEACPAQGLAATVVYSFMLTQELCEEQLKFRRSYMFKCLLVTEICHNKFERKIIYYVSLYLFL